jgi:hypothetical protein
MKPVAVLSSDPYAIPVEQIMVCNTMRSPHGQPDLKIHYMPLYVCLLLIKPR